MASSDLVTRLAKTTFRNSPIQSPLSATLTKRLSVPWDSIPGGMGIAEEDAIAGLALANRRRFTRGLLGVNMAAGTVGTQAFGGRLR